MLVTILLLLLMVRILHAGAQALCPAQGAAGARPALGQPRVGGGGGGDKAVGRDRGQVGGGVDGRLGATRRGRRRPTRWTWLRRPGTC